MNQVDSNKGKPASQSTLDPTGVEFQSVSKHYEVNGKLATKPAVDAISFTIAKGTLTTLLGPSGCGKTTTLRMIAGLESPTGGRILIDGQDVTGLGPAQRSVSLVFQSYALFPHMSVLDNVAYGPSVSGASKARAREQAREALATVGLQGYEARMPSELSGGQQQRVAVARALVLQPSVLLFDEPLSNLDARLRRQMREEIRALQQRLKLTVAYVTHDQSEALAVSDQVIVMDHGIIAQQGTPRDLYERPRSEFVAGFMGEAALLKATLLGGAAWWGDYRIPVLLAANASSSESESPKDVSLAVRPEAWGLSKDLASEGLSAKVLKATYLGGSYEYTMDTSLGEIFLIAPLQSERAEVGERVKLSVSGPGVSLLAGSPRVS